MPPFHLQANLVNVSANQLMSQLREGRTSSYPNSQYIFARAAELIRRPDISEANRQMAQQTLLNLATNIYRNPPLRSGGFGPVTATHINRLVSLARREPNSENIRRAKSYFNKIERLVPTWRNYPRTSELWKLMSSIETRIASQPSASVRKYAERWRLKGPVKLVNLPENKNNRTDPVSLHTFRTGQEAIRHQRQNTEGRVISTRYYLVPTIERLSGMSWNVIRRMHPNRVLMKRVGPGNKFLTAQHVPNVVTRLPVYRRNLTLVKFR